MVVAKQITTREMWFDSRVQRRKDKSWIMCLQFKGEPSHVSHSIFITLDKNDQPKVVQPGAFFVAEKPEEVDGELFDRHTVWPERSKVHCGYPTWDIELQTFLRDFLIPTVLKAFQSMGVDSTQLVVEIAKTYRYQIDTEAKTSNWEITPALTTAPRNDFCHAYDMRRGVDGSNRIYWRGYNNRKPLEVEFPDAKETTAIGNGTLLFSGTIIDFGQPHEGQLPPFEIVLGASSAFARSVRGVMDAQEVIVTGAVRYLCDLTSGLATIDSR